MDDPRSYSLGDSGNNKDSTAIVKSLDNIQILDSPGSRVLWMNPNGPPVPSVFQNPMAWNFSEPDGVGIIMGVEVVSGVGRKKLEWILPSRIGFMALP